MSIGTHTLRSTGQTFPFDHDAASALLEDPETFATVLHIICLAAYGDALYDDEGPFADPIALWTTLHDDFGVQLSEDGENRLNALLIAVTGEEFMEDPVAFISISTALYHGDLGGLIDGILEPPEFPVMLWGIYEVSLNRDMGDEPIVLADFYPSVRRLIAQTSLAEGDEEGPIDGVSYADKFVFEQKAELLTQLRRLGVGEDILHWIRESEETPVHDNEGQVTANGHEATPALHP